MPSVLLTLPFMITIILGFILVDDAKYYWWFLVPSILVLAVIYMFHPQINWWFWKRSPPKLDRVIEDILDQHHAYYSFLTFDHQERFRIRLAMFMESKDFVPKEFPLVSEELKALVGASIVQLTLGRKDFILDGWDKIIVYQRAFRSPQIKQFHSGEVQLEDKALMLSGDAVVKGAVNSVKYYDVGLHHCARVFKEHFKVEVPTKVKKADFLDEVLAINGKTLPELQSLTGMYRLDPFGVATVYFFKFPSLYKQKFPELFRELSELYNQNPVEANDPVLDKSIYQNQW